MGSRGWISDAVGFGALMPLGWTVRVNPCARNAADPRALSTPKHATPPGLDDPPEAIQAWPEALQDSQLHREASPPRTGHSRATNPHILSPGEALVEIMSQTFHPPVAWLRGFKSGATLSLSCERLRYQSAPRHRQRLRRQGRQGSRLSAF